MQRVRDRTLDGRPSLCWALVIYGILIYIGDIPAKESQLYWLNKNPRKKERNSKRLIGGQGKMGGRVKDRTLDGRTGSGWALAIYAIYWRYTRKRVQALLVIQKSQKKEGN